MCLAIPAKVIAVRDSLATVEAGGVERDISLMLLPKTSVGDYVLVHAGFAIEKVTDEEAQET